MSSRHSEQELPRWRRAVLKVGSSLLAANGGGLSTRHALGLAEFIASSHRAGREVVLVSSGAVAAGRALVRSQPEAAHGLAARQALAAIGQTTVVANPAMRVMALMTGRARCPWRMPSVVKSGS